MKIKIGNARKIFYFKYERVNGEVELLWKIENSKKRWLWLHYSNSKRDKRIWEKEVGDYHFCLQIPKVIKLDTTYVGKQLFGSRINLTRLFKKDYHVYTSSENEVNTQN
jgi:hypothetical protein